MKNLYLCCFILLVTSCSIDPVQVDPSAILKEQNKFRKRCHNRLHQLQFIEAKEVLDSMRYLITDQESISYIWYLFSKSKFLSRLRKYDESLVELSKAQEISERNGYVVEQMQCFERKKTLHYMLGNSELVAVYHQKAAVLCAKLNTPNVCRTYHNMCLFDAGMNNNVDSFLYYNRLNGSLDENNVWQRNELANKFNLGLMYEENKQYDLALQTYGEVISKSLKEKDKATLCNAYNVKARIHYAVGQRDSMDYHYVKSLEYCHEIKDYDILSEVYWRLYQVDNQNGSFTAAISNLNKYVEVKEKIHERENSQNLKLKEYEIDALRKEIEMKRYRDKKENESKIQKLIITAFGITCGLLYLLYRSVRKEKMALRDVLANKERMKEVERQQREQAYKTRLIRANLSYSDKLYQDLSMKLHDELGGLLAGVKFNLSSQLINKTNPRLSKAIEAVDEAYAYTRKLSHVLRPLSLGKENFSEFLYNYIDDSIRLFPAEAIIVIDSEACINNIPHALKSEIYRILQELLINIGKHSGASQVEFEAYCDDNCLFLNLADNGVGMDLLSPNKKPTGIGLSNIKQRMIILGGKFNLSSTPNQGTRIRLEIPLG